MALLLHQSPIITILVVISLLNQGSTTARFIDTSMYSTPSSSSTSSSKTNRSDFWSWFILIYLAASWFLGLFIFVQPIRTFLIRTHDFIDPVTTEKKSSRWLWSFPAACAPFWAPLWWAAMLVWGFALCSYWLGRWIVRGITKSAKGFKSGVESVMKGLKRRRERDIEGVEMETGENKGEDDKDEGGGV